MISRSLRWLPALLAPLLLAAAPVPEPDTAAARAWGISASDVPADPAVRYGVLPNGLKYALRHNETPKNTVAVRMRIKVGSLYEAEDQRGLAHFLEHMAFNGSTNVPEGEMVKLLERKGLAFGADTNASTGFDETIYKLDLPQPTDDLIDTALMLMHETASELTIAPEAVDRERGVVLSERRTRDTFQYKQQVDGLAFVFAGSKLADRIPIGTVEVLSKAPAARIRDLYDRYYRPERTTLVIVGDVDIAAVERKLIARFADWRGRGPGGGEHGSPPPAFDRGQQTDIFVAPEVAETASVTFVRPYSDEPDSVADRRRLLLERLGSAIVNRRIERIVQTEDTPVVQGSVAIADAFDLTDILQLNAVAKEGGWPVALDLIEREYRRALLHGFTDAELAERMANVERSLRNAVDSADTRRSDQLADTLIGVADGDRVVATPAQSLAMFEAAKPGITAASVSAAFQAAAKGFGAPLIRVTSRSPVAGGDAALAERWAKARTTLVEPPAAVAQVAFGYSDFGAAGRVVADERVEDLGIRRVRFANNVMLNLKRTDFERDVVRLSLNIDGGRLLNDRADPTRVYLADALASGGLGKHSRDELSSILAGRTVGFSFGAGNDRFGTSVTTRPQDFALQAQLLAALIKDPGYRPEGLAQLRRILPTIYAQNAATPAAVLSRDATGIITGDDSRFATPSLESVMALDWASLKTAIDDSLARGAIEIGVVGDFDEAAVIEAIAKSFGALPPRAARFAERAEARKVAFAADRSARTLLHQGDADQAAIRVYWSTTDDSDLATTLELDLLAAVMRLELIEQLREKLGKSYGGGASSDMSDVYPGFGQLVAAVEVDRADLAVAERTILGIANYIATKGIAPDLLDRARRPLLEAMTKARRENGYWLSYVGEASSRPERLDRSRKAIAAIEAMTGKTVETAAARWLMAERPLILRAESAKAPK